VKHAKQSVKHNKTGWDVIRTSTCEVHNQESNHFLGVTTEGWLFRCKETKIHSGHTFASHPDMNAPQDAEGAAKWFREATAKS